MSLALMALGAFGLWWLYGRHRALPDLAGVARANSEGRP
jgi:phosphatidylglycerol:prolipoprotein diacylglycerol transferase